MKLLTLLYVFCLFYVFIPGNVFKLPIKTSKMNIILIHALLFSVVLSCTYSLVENVRVLEGMSGAHEHEHEHDEYVKKDDVKKDDVKFPAGITSKDLKKPDEEPKKPAEEPKKPPAPYPVNPIKPAEEPKKPLPQQQMMQRMQRIEERPQ